MEHSEHEIWQFKRAFGDDARQEQWFEQKVDHFDPHGHNTWKQRYWRAETSGRMDGPQFLCIGGEGEATPWECSGPIFSYARDLNATVWTVEHRFYGRSQPFGDFSTEHLRYLSSEQAVKDLANFIETQNIVHNISNPQWVLFGGSYAGSLALWTRQLHPELTVGAVGSSAPMEPLLDFYQYMHVVENALRNFDPDCPERVKHVISHFSGLLGHSEGRAELSQRFNISLVDVSLSYNQTQSLFEGIVGSFDVQDLGHEEAKRVCDASRAKDPVDALREIVGDLSTEGYDEMISSLVNTSSEGRAWIWQTCNEFGWFQSTDIGGGIFGKILPVNNCTVAFVSSMSGYAVVNGLKLRGNKLLFSVNYGSGADKFEPVSNVNKVAVAEFWLEVEKKANANKLLKPVLKEAKEEDLDDTSGSSQATGVESTMSSFIAPESEMDFASSGKEDPEEDIPTDDSLAGEIQEIHKEQHEKPKTVKNDGLRRVYFESDSD